MTTNLESLIAQVGGSDPNARLEAARLLAQAGEATGTVASQVVGLLATEDDELREWLNSALEDAGPPSLDQCRELVEYLRQDRLDQAFWSATLLGRLGTNGRPAVDDLERSARDSAHEAVRRRAQWALGKIGRSG